MKPLAFLPYRLKLWTCLDTQVWANLRRLQQYQMLLMYKILWFHPQPRRILSTQVGTKTDHIQSLVQFPQFQLQLWKKPATQVSSFQTPLTTSLQLTRYFARRNNQLICFLIVLQTKIFRPFFSLGLSQTSVLILLSFSACR